MISFINGKIEFISEKYIVVSNQGIGFRVFTSLSTISKLKLNETIKVHTYMNVREDNISLYGFLTMEELNIFNLLLNVSGIGPKLAVSITNTLSPKDIVLSIVTEDFKTLSNCSGVGKKTAQRMVLELKDKLKKHDVDENIVDYSVSKGTISNERQDSIDALIALGYSKSDSMKAVMEVCETGMTIEEILKLSLKKLSSN